MNAYAQTAPPTVAEAQEFMNKAEVQFAELVVKVNRATWVQETYITDDTEAIAADAIDQSTAIITDLVEHAKRFDGLTMPPELARKFMLLKLSLTAPAPKDPALRKEMTTIASRSIRNMARASIAGRTASVWDITAIEKIMAHSRDPEELKEL